MANAPVTTITSPSVFTALASNIKGAPFFVANEALNSSSPPTITNYVPPLGTEILPAQPIQFDVTDESGEFAAILVYANLGGARPVELVHDSNGFRFPYSSGLRTSIANGYRYVVRRSGGWPTGPSFVAHAIDRTGSVNS